MTVRVELHAGERGVLRPLFELADESATELDAYLHAGRVLVALDEEEVVGHLQLLDTARGEYEIKNMAVLDRCQGTGIGARLVDAALRLVAGEDGELVRVATAAAGVGVLRFYQRQGFRMRSIERDAFTPEKGYPAGTLLDGVELRDRVWLDRDVVGRPATLTGGGAELADGF